MFLSLKTADKQYHHQHQNICDSRFAEHKPNLGVNVDGNSEGNLRQKQASN